MNISFYLILYLLTLPVFFAIDILWLGVVAKGFYRRKLDFILSPDVNWPAAIVFYLIYIAGILFLWTIIRSITKSGTKTTSQPVYRQVSTNRELAQTYASPDIDAAGVRAIEQAQYAMNY